MKLGIILGARDQFLWILMSWGKATKAIATRISGE